MRYDFKAAGMTFKGTASHRFVVFTRFPGTSKLNVHVWHEMRSYDLPKTLRYVFDEARRVMPLRYTIAIDTVHEELVAMAQGDSVSVDRINELDMREES